MTIHYAAGTFLLAEPTGRALLLHRTDGSGWSHPGGHVEPGEEGTPELTALRELDEETGLHGIMTECVHHFRLRSHDGIVVVMNEEEDPPMGSALVYDLFVVTVREEFKPRLDGEHQDWSWVDPREPGLPLHPGCAAVIRYLEKFL